MIKNQEDFPDCESVDMLHEFSASCVVKVTTKPEQTMRGSVMQETINTTHDIQIRATPMSLNCGTTDINTILNILSYHSSMMQGKPAPVGEIELFSLMDMVGLECDGLKIQLGGGQHHSLPLATSQEQADKTAAALKLELESTQRRLTAAQNEIARLKQHTEGLPAFRPGERIEGNYAKEGAWFGGTIKKCLPDAKYEIKYDDEESEVAEEAQLRRPEPIRIQSREKSKNVGSCGCVTM